MDLQEFIKETLVQIAGGISDAQSELSESSAIISPSVPLSFAATGKSKLVPTNKAGSATMVSFDVALTATEGTGTQGGIGVVAGIVNLGSSGQSSNENSSISRVQFDVPLQLPRGS